MGLEPTTFRSEVGRAIHYATEPIIQSTNTILIINPDKLRLRFKCKKAFEFVFTQMRNKLNK